MDNNEHGLVVEIEVCLEVMENSIEEIWKTK